MERAQQQLQHDLEERSSLAQQMIEEMEALRQQQGELSALLKVSSASEPFSATRGTAMDSEAYMLTN